MLKSHVDLKDTYDSNDLNSKPFGRVEPSRDDKRNYKEDLIRTLICHI